MLDTSVAVTVPIAVWFSTAVKLAEDVNTGAVSSTSVMVTVTFCVELFVPSVTVTVAVIDFVVS